MMCQNVFEVREEALDTVVGRRYVWVLFVSEQIWQEELQAIHRRTEASMLIAPLVTLM